MREGKGRKGKREGYYGRDRLNCHTDLFMVGHITTVNWYAEFCFRQPRPRRLFCVTIYFLKCTTTKHAGQVNLCDTITSDLNLLLSPKISKQTVDVGMSQWMADSEKNIPRISRFHVRKVLFDNIIADRLCHNCVADELELVLSVTRLSSICGLTMPSVLYALVATVNPVTKQFYEVTEIQ